VSRNKKSAPANVKKQYANFAHCDKCDSEQQMKRVHVIGSGPKSRWMCKKCGDMVPADRRAPSKEF
jgi:transposase-like protein